MATIAFVGLGRMGIGMAARLISAGHRLRLYNRTAARAEPLVRQGALLCAEPKQACDGAHAVFSMLADDDASRAVWLGPSGVLAAALADDAFAIECSTLSHQWVLELSRHAQRRGMRYLDAPVTGLPDAAADGTLTLLVGGEPAHLDAAQPYLAPIATRIQRFGAVGAGTAYKLIVNLLGAVQIASAAEAMALAERAGLDLSAVSAAIASGQAASPQVVRNVERMARGNHAQDVVFTPALRAKDVRYALALARELSIGSPFGALAEAQLQALIGLGLGGINESGIIEVARRG